MKADALIRRRIVVATDAFVELVVWRLSAPLPPSTHRFKYRLAYVVRGACVVLYDNERGKGDHRHFAGREAPYRFASPERLIADFDADRERWDRENRRP
ncbi:MAG: hypothetical protein FIB05_01830 [Betaproteobacteria bacterium]|nr:hypothetical protein [Betaproteobacteria bacterium]PWB66433.1 MAG: hypothetical protein C3F16_01675 [Betaproteobacteria bacterium]